MRVRSGLVLALACAATLAVGGGVAQAAFTLESSFGSGPGSGLGEFNEPHGVAVEAGTGDVFVVDTNNERVEKFEPEAGGKYKAVGVIEDGFAFGPYSGIAVDNSSGAHKGDMYVASKEKVYQFKPKAGHPNEYEPTGIILALPEKFEEEHATEELSETEVRGVAVSESSGQVFVTDEKWLGIFEPTGTEINLNGEGDPQNLNGNGGSVRGVAVAGSDVYVLTPHAGELDVFGWTLNASTHQLENKTEIAAGEFYAVGVDPEGRIYAYDEEGAKATHHVDVFAAGAGAHASPVEEFGAGTIGESTGIAYSPHGGGTVYVTDATSNQVHVYTPTKYALTVTKNGTGSGTVECNTGSGPGACAAEYNEGTKVKLTETAAGGSTFAGWSEACTGTGSCEVTITAATKVTATFNLTPPTKYALTVTKNGTGSGTVECNTGSGPGACAAEYNEGTKVKLTETAAGGSTFAGWSEACTGTGSCEVTITAATKVTATFNLTPPTKYALTVTKNGTGSGTVECNTGSGPGACAAEYNEGTKVKLTETAAGGSTFAGWSEACTGTGSCEVTITAATKVTATFNLTPVTKEGKLTVSGSATVSGGKALLKLSCSAAGACSGKLELTIQIKQRHRLKTVVIGRVSYGIAAGQSQTVKVKLSGVANHLLKQFKTLDATLTGPGGLKRTVKLKLKLSQEASLEKRKA